MNKFSTRDVPHFYSDSKTDALAKLACSILPPSNPERSLPKYWVWKGQDKFLARYSDLGTVVWSKQHSYHALYISGLPILRLWTVYPDKARLEVNENLYNLLGSTFNIKHHPNGRYIGQTQVQYESEIEELMNKVKTIYGV